MYLLAGLGLGSVLSSAQLPQLLPPQDKAHTITVLQDTVTKARVSLEAYKRTAAAECKKKLAQQKDAYDAVVQRHLQFIDQLLADKTALNEKVENLTASLQTVETAWESRLRTVRERAAVDMKRAQDAWVAGEKQRKETLVRKLEKEIKQETAKALEPEVQRILDRQRGELERLRDEYDARLQREKADLVARHADELTRVKLSVEAKVMEAVDAEKRALATRERDLRVECESQVKDVRARCLEDMDTEMRRHGELMREERARHASEVVRLRQDYETRIDAMLRKEVQARQEAGARVSTVIIEDQKVGSLRVCVCVRVQMDGRLQLRCTRCVLWPR